MSRSPLLRVSICLPVVCLLLGSAAMRAQEAPEERPLRILVTNDDGIDSPAIAALARELSALGEVVVCAPEGNRSGSSQSITLLGEPLTVTRVEVEGAAQAFAVSGSPADATAYAILALGGEQGFDFVVSGINRGANVGDVAHYSGTVGAAMEGAYRGIPSIAVSQASRSRSFDLAARFTARFVRAWSDREPDSAVVWSINVPADTVEAIAGVVPAPMGGSYVQAGTVRRVSGDDDSQVVRAEYGFVRSAEEGSDTHAYLSGSISVTPLRFDWTDHESLADVATWGLTVGP